MTFITHDARGRDDMNTIFTEAIILLNTIAKHLVHGSFMNLKVRFCSIIRFHYYKKKMFNLLSSIFILQNLFYDATIEN